MTVAPIVARTSSPEETRELAAAMGGELVPGDLVLLVGDLGAGKTTFTQGLARGLGVTDPVTSPTFTLVRAYRCGPVVSGSVRTLLHADLYRLGRLQDVVDLGIGEMVEVESVAVIEWGDVAASVFGPEVLTVGLAAGTTDEERIVTLTLGGAWSVRSGALAARLHPWTVAATDEHRRRRA